MGDKDVVLVVPTIRKECFNDFVKRWEAIGLFDTVDLILMEDNPSKTFGGPAYPSYFREHLCWEDIEKELGKDAWIIPRRSDTVRSFAYYKAWKFGYKYILTLDDDCYPCTEQDGLKYDGRGFVNEHVLNLTDATRWHNTLSNVIPRGIPYLNRGFNNRVIVSHGLWTNVIDYDAPHQLVSPSPVKHEFNTDMVPTNQYFPMCGMNVMWKAEATVLMYHMLMGSGMSRFERALPLQKLPFDRFGDIWCGIFMKKILDMTRHNVSTGMPYIRHERASNPFTNLKKEANGIEVNERLWEHVDDFIAPSGFAADSTSFAQLYRQLGQHIRNYSDFPEHAPYFKDLGDAMVIWSTLFEKRT